MVSEIRIYAEGGGDQRSGKAAVQEGFSKFLSPLKEMARERHIRWYVVACGSRQSAFDAFEIALKQHRIGGAYSNFLQGGGEQMKYLGIVKKENGTLAVPDSFRDVAEPRTYEAVQVGGDILLLSTPLDRERLKKIDELTEISIRDHRKTLEGLAR